MSEDKIKQLEQKNKELEANIQTIYAMNAQNMSMQFQPDDEIDLYELWKVIWDGKMQIVKITFVFAIVSVIFALSIPNEYKSTAVLLPVSSSNNSSFAKLAGQFGGLASLTGVNLFSGRADDKPIVAMEIIKSWSFLEKFITENNIEVEVFAAEGWNRETNELIIDDDLYDVSNQMWVRNFDPDKGETLEPSSWELFEKINNRFSITQNKENGLINLSVEHYSPNIAKDWTEKLVKAINLRFQEIDKAEAIKSIKYLNDKIEEINVTGLQSVFYQLIEEQTKTLMLAEISDEYIFKTISPPKTAEEKHKPKRLIIVMLGCLLGGIISVMIVIIRNFSKKIIL